MRTLRVTNSATIGCRTRSLAVFRAQCTAPMVVGTYAPPILTTPRARRPRFAGHVGRALPGTSAVPELPVEKDDLPGYLAVLGLAMGKLSSARLTMTPELLYSSLAVYQLVYCVLSVIEGKFEADRVGNVVAPFYLAASALNFFNGHLTPFQAATAGFGYFLAKRLPGPLPIWLASLAYAIYSNHAAEWAVAAFGLSAAWKIAEAAKEKVIPKPEQVAFFALAAWSFYAGITDQIALLIFGGHVLSSTIS